MTTDSPHDITLGQFTAVFVPSGLLLAWALFAPEFGGDLEVTRTRLTMWAVIFLVLPSLVLYLFRRVSQRTANISHLLWTAALAIFLIHIYCGMFYYYGTVGVTFRGQGAAIFIPNVTMLVVWIIDAMLLWLAYESHAGTLFHNIVRIAFAILFSLDMIVGRIGAPQILGFVFAGVLVIAVLARYAMTRVRLTA
jgi:hypothetical protein